METIILRKFPPFMVDDSTEPRPSRGIKISIEATPAETERIRQVLAAGLPDYMLD